MFAGRGAARLLLVAAFAVAVTGVARRPRGKPTRVYRPNKDAAMLLKHVMEREKQWALVLQEPVKMLDKPPYTDRAFKRPKLLLPPDAEKNVMIVYNVHEIVTMVSSHYSPIRSFVEYGAKVVRRALACFTFRMLLFQFKCIRLMMMKDGDSADVSATVYNLRNNAAAYIDILAAVPDDDLSDVLTIYWNTVKASQHESMERLDRQPWPEWLMDGVKKTFDDIDEFLRQKCHDYLSDEEYYLSTGIMKLPPLFKDPSLDTLMKVKEMAKMTSDQGNFMAQYARNLGIITLPRRLWTSVFFSRGLPRSDESVQKKTDPKTSESGPSTSESGPSTSESGPSTSEAGPSTSEAVPPQS